LDSDDSTVRTDRRPLATRSRPSLGPILGTPAREGLGVRNCYSLDSDWLSGEAGVTHNCVVKIARLPTIAESCEPEI